MVAFEQCISSLVVLWNLNNSLAYADNAAGVQYNKRIAEICEIKRSMFDKKINHVRRTKVPDGAAIKPGRFPIQR